MSKNKATKTNRKTTGKTPARPVVGGEAFPRIGLALGSGAAKALCQFGLIRKFQENKIPVSFIVGSSMGAILGGIMALDLNMKFALEKAYRYAEATNLNNLTNFNLLHGSVYKSEYTERLLDELFGAHTFEDCKIPLVVTSVDLLTGEVIALNKGPLVPAIKASTSIPGIFTPVLLKGRYLVDGGLLEDCPIGILKKMGSCDLLIGSSIKDVKNQQFIAEYIQKKFFPRGKKKDFIAAKLDELKDDVTLIGAIILRSLDVLRSELWKYKKEEARPDLIYEIHTENINFFDFKKARELVKIGEKAFDRGFGKLKALIKQKKMMLNAAAKNDNL